jgi:hypothetical protein
LRDQLAVRVGLGRRAEIDLLRRRRGTGYGAHAAADDGAAGDTDRASDQANGGTGCSARGGATFNAAWLAAAASRQKCHQSYYGNLAADFHEECLFNICQTVPASGRIPDAAWSRG